MKLFVLLFIACNAVPAAWTASVHLKRAAPTATLEEILEQFEKTRAGIREAVQGTDQQLKEILNGKSTLPLVEKQLFDAEFVVALIAEGALNELLENANADQHQLITNVLKQMEIIVVQTVWDIQATVLDDFESIVPVSLALQSLVLECEAQIAPLIDLIEGRK